MGRRSEIDQEAGDRDERFEANRRGLARRLRVSVPFGSTVGLERLARKFGLMDEFRAWVRKGR